MSYSSEPVSKSSLTSSKPSHNLESKPDILPDDLIRIKANLLAVKIFSVDEQINKTSNDLDNVINGGSGFLFDRQFDRQEVKQASQNRYVYLVLTNKHVIEKKDSQYYVRTMDGLIHPAFEYKQHKFAENVDLGILYFYSPVKYLRATFSNLSDFKEESSTFVAGYECDLTISEGKICPYTFYFSKGLGTLASKPLQNGYQITLTNDTKRGTSGGPIFNDRGQVIGVNGRGKSSPNSEMYEFEDKSGRLQQNIPTALGVPINRNKLPIQTTLQLPNKDYIKSYLFIDSTTDQIVVPYQSQSKENNTILILSFALLLFSAGFILRITR